MQLPRNLYRVQYSGCNTEASDTGLSAADTISFFDEQALPQFRKSIVNQFTRDNRTPTPYISLFSDHTHAENWALKMGDDVQLLHVDTAQLADSFIFKLSTLISALPVTIPDAAAQHIQGAYLCLHRVPRNAIVAVIDRDDIATSMRHVTN